MYQLHCRCLFSLPHGTVDRNCMKSMCFPIVTCRVSYSFYPWCIGFLSSSHVSKIREWVIRSRTIIFKECRSAFCFLTERAICPSQNTILAISMVRHYSGSIFLNTYLEHCYNKVYTLAVPIKQNLDSLNRLHSKLKG